MTDAQEPRRAFGKGGARSLLIDALRKQKPVEDIPAFLPPANGVPVSQNGLGGTQVAPEPENAPAASAGAPAMPTADEVARAIVAAARETGADPIELASGARGNRHHPDILRARAYAAVALRSQFSDVDWKTIARVVGVWTPATAYSYLKTLDEQRERGYLDWWSVEAYDRVIQAIRP